jgi:hypothetical protein
MQTRFGSPHVSLIWRHTSNLLVSSLFVTPSTYRKRRCPQKRTNPRRHFAVATKFFTVPPNILGPFVWNLCRVTLLEPRIFSLLPHFFNLYNPAHKYQLHIILHYYDANWLHSIIHVLFQATTTHEHIQHTHTRTYTGVARLRRNLRSRCYVRPSVVMAGYSCHDLNPAPQEYEATELPTLVACTFPVHKDKSLCPERSPNIPMTVPHSRPNHAVSQINSYSTKSTPRAT